MKFYSLADRNMKEVYRDPVPILLGLIMPIALLVLFTSIYKRTRLEIFSPQMLTPGIIIFSFALLIMFSAIVLSKDRENAFLIRLFTAPLRSSDFILSYMLPFIPLAIFQILACFFVGALLGVTFDHVFISILIFLLVAVICISLGVILGTFFTVNQVSGVGSLLVTAVGLFCGAWTPLRSIGGVFETIGYSLPFAHGVDATKELLSGSGFAVVANSFYVVLIYSVILLIFAILSFKRIMKKT